MNIKRGIGKVIKTLLWLAAIGFAGWTALVLFVTYKEHTVPAPSGESQAIIVLGAQVKPDGTLSVQLEWRMEEALKQYQKKTQPIVVCGAQGANEPGPEAHYMRDWLLEKGVPSAHVLIDDASFNTRQNLQNAKKLLDEDIKRVLIVTSNYHLPRSVALAEDLGLEAEGVGSPIKLLWWAKNHYREALAWVKYLMQKWGVMPI